VVATLIAMLLAGVAGWVIGGQFDPSHGELRAAADALVPPGAIVTQRGENTGHPLIVGSYFASVEFEVPGTMDLDSALVRRSREFGYSLERVNVTPGLTNHKVIRQPIRATLSVSTGLTDEGNVRGAVRAEADPGSKRNRRLTGAVLSSVVTGCVALLVGWRRRAP
jgi:hypothetical protein